jgi:hypothetical protein
LRVNCERKVVNMRIGAAALLALLVCASSAEARQRDTGWGIKGGVNFATLTLDQDVGPDFEYRIGLVAGGFFTFPLGERFDVQPEVLYTQRGATLDALGVDATIKLDSLEVPVLVRYGLGSGGRGLVLFGGPSVGFKLRAEASAALGGTEADEDISDEIEDVDFGLVFGAGWEAGRFSIDGRYTWGLTGIGVDPVEEGKTTHRVISILVGYRF